MRSTQCPPFFIIIHINVLIIISIVIVLLCYVHKYYNFYKLYIVCITESLIYIDMMVALR